MFCKYCGRQIADDSKFCEYCGSMIARMPDTEQKPADIASLGDPIIKENPPVEQPPVEEVPATQPPVEEPPVEEEVLTEAEKKKISPALLWSLIGGGAVLLIALIIVLGMLLGNSTVFIDITRYADFTVSGYDGYGKATCEIDWDGLEVAAFGEYPDGSDAAGRKKQIEYKEKAAILKGAVKIRFEEKNNVSVGDVLVAEFEVDTKITEKLGLDISSLRRVEYTVRDQDLTGSTAIDLLGEFVDVRFEGLDGVATAAVIVKERTEDYVHNMQNGTEYTISVDVKTDALQVEFLNSADKSTETVDLSYTFDNNEGLSVGDKVTLTISSDSAKALMDYGLVLQPLSAEYTAEGLEKLVSDFSEIDTELLEGWKTTYAESLEKYIDEHWNECLHGGNFMLSITKGIEDMTYVQGLLITNNDPDGASNELYLVYTANVWDEAILISNYGSPLNYTFAVRLSNLRVDSEGKLIEDKILLPSEEHEDFFGGYVDLAELVNEVIESTDTVVTEIE
ncbi:MAG: zinc ribbon domain-containing protein [Clostridia bacterium]|nr:zinc ribbon domain-containing protein [Clostridia bacterium]